MARVRFYPVEANYTLVAERPVVQLFGRTEEGKRITVLSEGFQPYFWVIPEDDAKSAAEKLAKMRAEDRSAAGAEVHEKYFLGKKVEAVKVFARSPKDVPALREEAKKYGECLEADILYKRRYLIDHKIIPMTLHEAEGEVAAHRVKCDAFRADRIEGVSQNVLKNPRVMAIDIETYNPEGKVAIPESNPIIMVAFCGNGFEKVITWKRFKTEKKYIEFVDSEAKLLDRIREVIEERQPDIIVGYYSDGFDMPYIKARADKYKIKMDFGLDYSQLKISGRTTQTAEIAGISHLDILKFIKKVHRFSLHTPVYDLNSVATEMLGEGKADVDIERLFKAWDENSEELEAFCSYNLKDAQLTLRITEQLLPNLIELTKMIGLTIDDVSRMSFSQLVEWYLIRQAPSFNELVPNRPSNNDITDRKSHSYEGGFVYEPKPGLYDDIVVFDFRSLYPTIISAHNISPDMLDCGCCRDTEKVPDGEHWFCKKRKGFISTVIEDVINRRMRVKEIMRKSDDRMLEARQQALKTVANSIYGYLGFFGARWYSMESAKAITAYGRYYIKSVIAKAKENGFSVIYSDTDSIFLALKGRKEQEAKSFMDSVNMELPGIMELEYEGYYPSGIFVSTRTTGYGAKKKYALLSESGAMKIRGFETVRRNLAIIAKEVQENVLNIILREKSPEKALEYVKETVKKLRERKIETGKVVITTQ
ncbi:ribonuclease H-like domain-containing protein, partial [Candidatus Woesearchaeota archaeon]|nr:ribonuclease H-like domain-containing protein [Candidatus Woesearchaeota archaeon]